MWKKKDLPSTLFLESKVPYKKKNKKKDKDKSLHSQHSKVKKEIYLALDFLKLKYHTKRKNKGKDKSLHSPHSKY